jgi:hypothetical protein
MADNDSMEKNGHGDDDPQNGGDSNSWQSFLNPVVAIAGLILLGVLFLLFCAIVGWDKGNVLRDMGQIEYARGLITYLFAVVTIGTAVILVVSALISPADDQHQKKFERGKEILALLLGVFGTIVGFYFGSEVSKGADQTLHVAPMHLSSSSVAPGAKFNLMTFVSGGVPPYRFGAALDNTSVAPTEEVDKSGWIEKDLTAPSTEKEESIVITIRVQDAHNNETEQSAKITVSPPH